MIFLLIDSRITCDLFHHSHRDHWIQHGRVSYRIDGENAGQASGRSKKLLP
jgi:hypothetical protein